MNQELIRKTEEFLKQKLNESPYFKEHPSDGEYRLQHSYRVANIGKAIAEKEGFDVTEMVIACLLHDVSYCQEFKTKEEWIGHGRTAADIARPFLTELGLPQDRIEDICFGIGIHVDDDAGFEGVHTPFAETVGNADDIDRFDVYRIHETLLWKEFTKMSYAEKVEYVDTTLADLKEYMNRPLGTKAAEEMWKERVGYYTGFYEKLKAQLDNSTCVM